MADARPGNAANCTSPAAASPVFPNATSGHSMRGRSYKPARIVAMHPVAQGLPVPVRQAQRNGAAICATGSTPQVSAASSRDRPSITNAIVGIPRAALASRVHPVSCRKSPTDTSRRMTATAMTTSCQTKQQGEA